MTTHGAHPRDERARVAIDLGAESCRVSLLRWAQNVPSIVVVHRFANGPVHRGKALHWPLSTILEGLYEGLRKAAEIASEGIASIAVDGWAVDYVRLSVDGRPLQEPFCYRDERNIAAKETTEELISSTDLFRRTGAQPLRINTVYQLIADRMAGNDKESPWVCLPEYVLHWLGGRRVAEFTNATHTGLVDLATGDWSPELFALFDLSINAAPPIVPAGTVLGKLVGPLAQLKAFSDTTLIAPACHDTASAIAGISCDLASAAYICSGTWSLVGTVVQSPIATAEAMNARYTNQGAASGGFCFHSNVNGMWLVKQCMEGWAAAGRDWSIEELVGEASKSATPGIIDVDAEPLLLDSGMPQRINHELSLRGFAAIEDVAGNEPIFARVIFESLAHRYSEALANLESMLGRKLDRIHILGGGSRNKLLQRLTAERTNIGVEAGEAESSTIGNFAVQLAASEKSNVVLDPDVVRHWAARLSQN